MQLSMMVRMKMEFYENEPVSLYLSNLNALEKMQSEKQIIEIMEHPWLGKVLVINGEIQHIENYQALYHELLVHLPIAFVPDAKNVLILGGGSLFAAYEVLKYPTVQSVTLCDYDCQVPVLMKKYYNHASKVLNDSRFHFIEQEATAFILATTEHYDLIVNDCFNLAEISTRDHISYYEVLSRRCTKQGACVDIIYRHIFDRQTTIDSLGVLMKEQHAAFSLVVVPEYPGILHLETIWGNSPNISQSAKASLNKFQLNSSHCQSDGMFKFYNPDYLPYYLYLPPYIKEMFNL